MPTQFYEPTPTPADLVAALTLVDGTTYTCRFQVAEVQAVVKVVESATAVTADSAALLIRRFEDFSVKPAAGLAVYVWSDAADGVLVVNEVPT